ncbi:MAG TPA: HEAT repeat domain-containing protein [Pyrinomonadaceae bacterium]
MSHGLRRTTLIGSLALLLMALPVLASQQTKTFIPVEGATLKAKIDNAIAAGRTNALNGRFWVAYQFEVRPNVAVDFEIVNGNGVYVWNDDSITSDPRYETRELGFFMMYDTQREAFTRADIYNLRRDHEYGNYPVYWAGRISNEESLNYLKSIVDTPNPDANGIGSRALYAISLHDDARVDTVLTEFARRPAGDAVRFRAISLLGTTPETQAKNTLLAEIVRNNQENKETRQTALAALAMSRSAGMLPVLENLFETMPARELKRIALRGIGRNDNSDAAATYLIRVIENEKDIELRKSAIANLGRVPGPKSLTALISTIDGDNEIELQKQATLALGRRSKDEAVPVLIRVARNHPQMPVRKVAIQVLGQTGDQRAVAFFSELLRKD